MRRIVIAAVVATIAIVTAAPAPARNPTFVTHNCTDVKQRPSRILFACGDGNYYATKLHWRYWHLKKAVARGVFHANDCDPDCADGHFHKRRGTLVLRFRMRCNDIDKNVFKHAKAVYDGKLNGSHRTSFGLYCPF